MSRCTLADTWRLPGRRKRRTRQRRRRWGVAEGIPFSLEELNPLEPGVRGYGANALDHLLGAA
eukprot:3399000-Rhodomonas_salina.4